MTGSQTRNCSTASPASGPLPVPLVPTQPDRGCSLFIKSAALLQLLVELPSGGILQNQVDPPPVIEIVVETQDVGMPREETEDLGCILA